MPKNSIKTDANDRGRFSARRKTEAVLRLLRGEDLDTNGMKIRPMTLPGDTLGDLVRE